MTSSPISPSSLRLRSSENSEDRRRSRTKKAAATLGTYRLKLAELELQQADSQRWQAKYKILEAEVVGLGSKFHKQRTKISQLEALTEIHAEGPSMDEVRIQAG